jgi:hypothetical protein
LKIIDFIVCEDIRNEVGNKVTLIGVYDQQLNMLALPNPSEEKWPKPVRLAFFIRIKVSDGDTIPDTFKLQFFQDGKEVTPIQQNIGMPPKNVALVNIGLVFNNFRIFKIGKMNFQLTLLKDGKVIFEVSPEYVLNIALTPPQDMFKIK